LNQAKAEDQQSMFPVRSIPDELAMRIFACLPAGELAKLSPVSKKRHASLAEKSLWKWVDQPRSPEGLGHLNDYLACTLAQYRANAEVLYSSFVSPFTPQLDIGSKPKLRSTIGGDSSDDESDSDSDEGILRTAPAESYFRRDFNTGVSVVRKFY
jgi:hypothetical protein